MPTCLRAVAAFAIAALCVQTAAAKSFVVTDYGAVGDGTTMNTDAFAKTIDACAADGGGVVEVPPGTYLTGPIELKSNIDLDVQAGATILYSRQFDDYPLRVTSFEGRTTVECTSPLWGDNLHDVSITGAGVFDGQGEVWRPTKRSKMTDAQWRQQIAIGGVVDESGENWYPSQEAMTGGMALARLRARPTPPNVADYVPYRDLLRPPLVTLSNCKHVLLEGVTFRNSPGWNIHLLLSDDIVVWHLTVFNEIFAQNGDGIDIDSCRQVLIANSNVCAGDDDICLKSGRDAEGRALNRPTEDVMVHDCQIGHGHGGIAIGSEMSGGVRNLTVENCVFDGTDTPLRFKSVRGRGGVVEDIHISDVKMSNITQAAIQFDMFYMSKHAPDAPQPVTDATPIFRNITIRNATCSSAQTAILLRGLPEMPIQNVTLENVDLTADKAGSLMDGKDLTFRNVHIHANSDEQVSVKRVENLVLDNCDGIAQP
ncbi:MAG TPA: glycoside hydrolase family 28 protein [Tepidisphaeraceae bacterium]|nr:glycoside hydrolase family 28 protein [Tepidisphaeraceae bacterium]